MKHKAAGRLAYLAMLAAIFALKSLSALAVQWVPIEGKVRLADGTPICAMVLANGQYMFSCGGDGDYSLDVPLDDRGKVTLFAFADGFAPFRVTASPNRLPSTVRTRAAAPDSPAINVPFLGYECSVDRRNWARISGQIASFGGDSLCAMVLANGQHMFTCGESLGEFELTVPADEDGNVTLFAFADGFQPYSETLIAPECSSHAFDGTYTGSATPTKPFPPGVACGTGSFQVTISGADLNGSATDSWGRSYAIAGVIAADGALSFGLAAAVGNVASFDGNVSGFTMSGTWSDVYGCHGPWSGSKQ